jgi:hypothetical protein
MRKDGAVPVVPLRDRLGADFFKKLPRLPGVYFMYGYGGSLIYVGKAKDLRARLSTYPRYATAPEGTVSGKVLSLVQVIEEIRFEVVETEEAALLRENALLREHRPFFNVINKNPQSYPLLGIRYLQPGEAQGNLFERALEPAAQAEARRSVQNTPHVEFWLTSREQDFNGPRSAEYRWFGSFKSKRMIREGVGAMLRLLWLCETQVKRFDFPREIQNVNPRRPYALPLNPAWQGALESFWSGRSPRSSIPTSRAVLFVPPPYATTTGAH